MPDPRIQDGEGREAAVCANCGKVEAEHKHIIDFWNHEHWYCYEFVINTSGKDANAEFQPAPTAPPPAAPSEADLSNCLAVLCRAVDDGADAGWQEFLAWYTPGQWLSPYRALGAFLRARLDRQRATAEAERDRLRGAASDAAEVLEAESRHADHRADDMAEEYEIGPAYHAERDRAHRYLAIAAKLRTPAPSTGTTPPEGP